MEEELTLLACTLLGVEWTCSCPCQRSSVVMIYFFPWRKWWRDYAPVFLCIITGFSRSTLRAWGVDWECRRQGWEGQRQRTLFFSWLKEGASAAVVGFWLPLSHLGLANMRASQKVHTDHLGGMGKGIYQNESIGKWRARQWCQGFLLPHLPLLSYFCFVWPCMLLAISCYPPKWTCLTEIS